MNDTMPFAVNGKFVLLALDHHGPFKEAVARYAKAEAIEDEVVELKRKIVAALLEHTNGMLLDVEYGLPAYQLYLRDNPLAHAKPYILRLEKSAVEAGDELVTELRYSVSQLKCMGAKSVKLLLHINPSARTLRHQIELARQVMQDCQKEQMHFLLEPLTYFLRPEVENKGSMITESLSLLVKNGVRPDVFKIEHPGSRETCAQVSKLLAKTPWLILTKGQDFEALKRDFETALDYGSAGILAGRSIWQDVLMLPKHLQEDLLRSAARKRLLELSEVVRKQLPQTEADPRILQAT